MNRLILTIGLAILASTFSFAQYAKNNYYPLEVGNKWHFRIEVGGTTTNAVYSITKLETFDKIPLARLEVEIDKKIAYTEHLAQTDQGVFRYRNNAQEVSPPICLLKYPAKSGAKWDGAMDVGKEKWKYFGETKEEMIEVAAGKFKALRVTIRLEAEAKAEKKITYWFVRDIGIVKQTVEAADLNFASELTKFEPANK
jgi:hypothetical protein